MSDILKMAEDLRGYCTACRHYIHENPELPFMEHKTTAFIKKELGDMGVEQLPLDIKTGVVAIINGTKPGYGHVTALRADIDALPIEDLCNRPYFSKTPGVAHSCGHDGHAAVMLGVAKLLSQLRDRFSGTVKLVFQPGEEALAGSLIIVNSGAMSNPDVEVIVALHCWPYLKAGEVGIWSGLYMASADKFKVSIVGKGGHGARPHEAVNPIVATSMAVTALQNIISSEINAARQAVISVCSIHSGATFNVIPEVAEFCGTARTLDETIRAELETRIRRIVLGIAKTMNCVAKIEYERGVPSLFNAPCVIDEIAEAGKAALGNDKVRDLEGPVMGSEDFSYLINRVGAGAFFRLGIGKDGVDKPVALHNGAFDFNDDAIPAGIATMVQYILNRHK